MPPKGTTIPLVDRFWPKIRVAAPDECWVWIGSCDTNGYGQIKVNDRNTHATRALWLLLYGELPPSDKQICHTCDNPPCCNPAHLFLGTRADNAQDMVKKGRHFTQMHPEKNGRAILTIETATDALRLRREGMPMQDIADRFGVCAGTIKQLISGKTWKQIPRET